MSVMAQLETCLDYIGTLFIKPNFIGMKKHLIPMRWPVMKLWPVGPGDDSF